MHIDKPEPDPNMHMKRYTMEDLELKYRTIDKIPRGYSEDVEPIAVQEQKFNERVVDAFAEMQEYQQMLLQKDRIASAEEAKLARKEARRIRRAKRLAAKKRREQKAKRGNSMYEYYN